MTTTPTSAEADRQALPSAGRDGLVIAATAVGGVLAVVAWMVLLYRYDLAHAGEHHDDGLAPWPYWSQFVLIPLVALVGGRFAPGRVRAVVVAACAGQVLFVLAMRLAFVLDHGWFALQLLVGEAVLVGLAWAAARLGRRLARR